MIWPTRPRADRDSSSFDRLYRSEVAINGLLPQKDNEVVSGRRLHKDVDASRKKALFPFVPLAVEYTRYSTNVARDDFVRSRNDNLEFKVLPVSQESWATMREPGGSQALRL